MGDQRKTKAQLITELNDLRRRVAELETSTVADDITARRRAEDALRESESFYHSLVEILPQSLCRKDLDGHFTFGNSQFLAPLNLSLAELVGKTDFDIHPPELAVKYRCDDRQVIETGQSLETAEEHAVLGGQTTFVQVVKSPIRDGAGKIIGVQIMFWDVTDRKRAEEALRQSGAHYRRLAENIGDVIWTMDMNFRFTDVTPSITQLLGLSVEEAMKRTLAETLTPASLALATQLIAEEVTPKVAQRDRYWSRTLEIENIHKDGSVIPVEVRLSFICDEHNAPIGILGVTRDMRERKRAEEELYQSQHLLRLILDNIPQRVFWKDRQLRYLGCNQPFADDSGLADPRDLIGKDDFDMSWRDVAKLYRADDQAVMDNDTPKLNYEEPQTRLDGRRLWLRTSKVPLRDQSGHVFGVLGVYEDITARKQAEEELAHHDRTMAALYETSLEINSQPDLPALLRTIVKRATDLLSAHMGGLYLMKPDGQSLELVVSQYLPKDYVGVTLQLGEGPSGRVAQTGQPLMIEDYHQWAGRATAYADGLFRRTLGVPMEIGERVLGVINITDDQQTGRFTDDEVQLVTLFADQAAIAVENARLREQLQQYAEALEQRVVERTQELQAAYERLTELDRLKDEFVSRISHELRTPLTSIRLYLELIEHGRPEKHEDYMQTLLHETERLQHLIEDLLKISQLDTEAVAVNLTPIDINRLVAELIKYYASLATQRGLELTGDFEPDLPHPHADAELVWQIMLNLMSNALSYTQHGKVTILTRQQQVDDQTWITIAVRDTGPGIAPEEIPHIFTRFYRGQAARDYKTPGTGLGLSISQQLVHKMSGRIAAESEPGEGATFTVWLK